MKKLLLVALVALFAVGAASAKPPYVTDEFRGGDSFAATAFICGAVGQHTGIEPDAMVWVVRAVKASGVSAEHAGRLLADSVMWLTDEAPEMDLMRLWVGECKRPMETLKQQFGN